MKAEEIRHKLYTELNENNMNLNINSNLSTIENASIDNYGKPMMFMPKKDEGRLEMVNGITQNTVKGIGFADTNEIETKKGNECVEIYNMKEFIDSNPENMQTFSYDPKVIKATQYALVKRRDWQDILFEDVDLFQKIDLKSGIKKLFKKF